MATEVDFSEPVPGFDDAIAVLHGYHTVMLNLCSTLRGLAKQVEFDSKESSFNTDAVNLYNYFMVATELHHRDEEKVLFPCLAPSSSLLISPMMVRLEEDHEEIEQVWEFLAPLLDEPESIVHESTDRCKDFVKASNRFAQLLQWHIEREEENFFPEVEKILSQKQLRTIGEKMAKLRSQAASA